MEKADKDKVQKQNTGLCMVHYVVNKKDEEDLRDLLVERGLDISSLNEN